MNTQKLNKGMIDEFKEKYPHIVAEIERDTYLKAAECVRGFVYTEGEMSSPRLEDRDKREMDRTNRFIKGIGDKLTSLGISSDKKE